jgi:hypothetical protein
MADTDDIGGMEEIKERGRWRTRMGPLATPWSAARGDIQNPDRLPVARFS